MAGRLTTSIRTIEWAGDAVVLLDQRLLPEREDYLPCRTLDEAGAAITDMVVRGAPDIGVTAAYGMALAAAAGEDLAVAGERLRAARPTAVNLGWAVDRLLAVASAGPKDDVAARLETEAVRVHEEDIGFCEAMANNGLELFPERARALTHCNTGALATAGIGTALGLVRGAHAAGRLERVYADETRPWLQGARLTAWECARDGIPCTLLADSAAASALAAGRVDLVIVGVDRMAGNGDTANKIGTYPLAVLAHRHGVPFYVAGPSSSVDLSLAGGAEIRIEERAPEEVTHVGGRRIAAEGVDAWNPAFDVTPAELITGIVTERGIARPPYVESLRVMAGDAA